jgi:hypothetical protein
MRLAAQNLFTAVGESKLLMPLLRISCKSGTAARFKPVFAIDCVRGQIVECRIQEEVRARITMPKNECGGDYKDQALCDSEDDEYLENKAEHRVSSPDCKNRDREPVDSRHFESSSPDPLLRRGRAFAAAG